jgi:hypothetical protein
MKIMRFLESLGFRVDGLNDGLAVVGLLLLGLLVGAFVAMENNDNDSFSLAYINDNDTGILVGVLEGLLVKSPGPTVTL